MGKLKRLHNASDRNPTDRPIVQIDVASFAVRAAAFSETLERDRNAKESSSGSALSFLDELNTQTSLTLQIKCCHQFKARFRPTLMSRPLPPTAQQDLFAILLLFLLPGYSPLRLSLDWVIDSVTGSLYSECKEAIVSACLEALRQIEQRIVSGLIETVSLLKDTSMALVHMSSLDRECQWLDLHPQHFAFYIQILQRTLSTCIQRVLPSDASASHIALLSEDGIICCESAADCLKAFASILKTRRQSTLTYLTFPPNKDIIESILQSSYTLLKSEHINRVRRLSIMI